MKSKCKRIITFVSLSQEFVFTSLRVHATRRIKDWDEGWDSSGPYVRNRETKLSDSGLAEAKRSYSTMYLRQSKNTKYSGDVLLMKF